jgi:hypothetical protein
MTSKEPRKKYFRPQKPVNKMTEEELDEFAQFVFDVINTTEQLDDDHQS